MAIRSPAELQVSVISLNKGIAAAITLHFPDAQHFPATDMRGSDPMQLLRDGVITDSAFEALTRGRKYHHEFSGIGGVGLCQSVLRLLNEGDGPILVLESDCIPQKSLPSVVTKLLAKSDQFHMAIFGPTAIESHLAQGDVHPKFADLAGYFWGTHAVLYSAHGRRIARNRLSQPFDMQIDGKMSRLSVYVQVLSTISLPHMRVLVQTKGAPLARQVLHRSTIQTKPCAACLMGPGPTNHKGYEVLTLMLHMKILHICVGIVLGTFLAGLLISRSVYRSPTGSHVS